MQRVENEGSKKGFFLIFFAEILANDGFFLYLCSVKEREKVDESTGFEENESSKAPAARGLRKS